MYKLFFPCPWHQEVLRRQRIRLPPGCHLPRLRSLPMLLVPRCPGWAESTFPGCWVLCSFQGGGEWGRFSSGSEDLFLSRQRRCRDAKRVFSLAAEWGVGVKKDNKIKEILRLKSGLRGSRVPLNTSELAIFNAGDGSLNILSRSPVPWDVPAGQGCPARARGLLSCRGIACWAAPGACLGFPFLCAPPKNLSMRFGEPWLP